jgi:hypothetical protein
METNEIWKANFTTSLDLYAPGDFVYLQGDSDGRMDGEIDKVSDNGDIFIKNVSYTGDPTTFNLILKDVGEDHLGGPLTKNISLVYRAIPLSEGVFWSPVTYYDIENERNAYSRSINILDKQFLTTAVDQLQTLLTE